MHRMHQIKMVEHIDKQFYNLDSENHFEALGQ